MRNRKGGVLGFNKFELHFILTGDNWLPMEINWRTLKQRYKEKKDSVLEYWNQKNPVKYAEYFNIPNYQYRKKNKPFAESKEFEKVINSF